MELFLFQAYDHVQEEQSGYKEHVKMYQLSAPMPISKVYRSRMLAQVLLAVFYLPCRFVDGRKLKILTLERLESHFCFVFANVV